jgi:hypothetical protein
MTNFKLISAAAILSVAIATPALAQEAAQEPGLQAFYQSLGVGSQSSATASGMASARSGWNASVPVKGISAKHYTSDHKMWQGRVNKSVPQSAAKGGPRDRLFCKGGCGVLTPSGRAIFLPPANIDLGRLYG